MVDQSHASLSRPGPGPVELALEAFSEAIGHDLNVAGAIAALNGALAGIPFEA